MTEPFPFQAFGARLLDFINRADLLTSETSRLAMAPAIAEFNTLACSLFALQFQHVAPYRRFCEARQATPKTVTNWKDIPALPVAAFKEAPITSLNAEERVAVFHSSGTTITKPSQHWHSSDSLRLYEASLLPPFRHHLVGDADLTRNRATRMRFIILTPSSALAPTSSLVHMFETARRELGAADSAFVGKLDNAGTWTLDIEHTVAAIRDSSLPIVLLGTAFSFVHLLDHFIAHELCYQLPQGSRVLETGGYKGRSRALSKLELHASIERHFGIPATHIVSEYGMSELSSQAYDGRIVSSGSRSLDAGFQRPEDAMPDQATNWHPRVFHFPPWARVQVISPETGELVSEGEAGLLRVFDLANVHSVLAIQTEDLGVRRGEGFELIGRAVLAEPRGCSLMSP